MIIVIILPILFCREFCDVVSVALLCCATVLQKVCHIISHNPANFVPYFVNTLTIAGKFHILHLLLFSYLNLSKQFEDEELDLEDGQVVAKRLLSQEDKVQDIDISMAQILKMNKPEWHLILIGSLSACVSGVIQPAFAILMSEIVGVCKLLW